MPSHRPTLAIVFCLCWICVTSASGKKSKTPPSAGHVGALVDHTVVNRSGASTGAAPGMQILWKDTLQTDKTGRVRVVLDDGSIITLGAHSNLEVIMHDAKTQQTRLELTYGKVRMQVAKITKISESFELRTPTAVAGVIGTDFGANSPNPNETDFVCITGTTRVYSLDKKSYVDCGPSSKLTVKRGEPLPKKASPAYVDDTERWKHITEPGDPLYPDPIR